MSDETRRDGNAGVLILFVGIVLVGLLGLALVGWISDTSAQRATAQVRIEAEQQAGATERTQVFGLTLASITAMATNSGVLPLLSLTLVGGLFYLVWKDSRRGNA